MNVYIFLVSFFVVYFCFISSTCCRRHDHRYVAKKIGNHLSKKALTDEQPDKRSLKTSKAGTQSGAIYSNENRLKYKRHDGKAKPSPKKGTRKQATLVNKKDVTARQVRERKNQLHSSPESHKTPVNSKFKPKKNSKKYSLAFAPSSSLTPQAQTEDGYQEYAPQTSGQLRYLTNNLGNAESVNQGSQDNVAQFTGQQEGYQTLNGGQNQVNAFQDNNGQEGQLGQLSQEGQLGQEGQVGQVGQEAQEGQVEQVGQGGQEGQEGAEGKQSVGTLQELMEQKALLSQQENPQENMQGLPNQQQQTVAFQGPEQQNREGQLLRQEEDEQESAPQDGVEQYQQGVGRQATEQQINVQQQDVQDGNNQEINVQGGEQGNLMQQGANQEAAFQQGNEQVNGEQQAGQMEGSFQQESGPELIPQQGNEQQSFLQQGNEQELSQQHGEMQEQTAAYQQDTEQTGQEQQGDQSEQRPADGGSIANLFAADSSNQGTGQDQETQSLINEGQSITKNDAAQLAAAIANANKGLGTSAAEQNSLANLASSSSGALSFTGSDQPSSNEGLGDLGSSVNRFTPENSQESTNGFSLVDHQEENSQKVDPFSQQYEQGSPTSSQSFEQDFTKIDGLQEHQHHVNTGIGNIAEESVKIMSLDNAVASKAAKYCTGCPRHARCIDKVCIINDDQPLAKILGALSGPENETDDCSGCHHNAKCIKKECICKPGFTGDGVECRVDSCLPGCSKHGKCIRGFCVCDHHHYFNGVECAPYKIRHRECPDKCVYSCLPGCPDRCCKSHMSTPKPAETTATVAAKVAPTATPPTKAAIKPITKTSNKKVGMEAAADFYLKPTLHNNNDVFKKHPHQEKNLHASNQAASSTQLSTPIKNTTAPGSKSNFTKDLKPQSEEKHEHDGTKTKANCHPECSGGKCGPSCPDHCCVLTKPSMQIDFLRAFAEKFCPSACQSKCQNTCPPICCEKRSFASILKSSPGASNVDVNKAEDIFRNAMGWFGMMNFLHMMYNMYGNMYKPQNMMSMKNPQNLFANVFRKMQEDQNAKIKAKVPGSPYSSLPCEPACAKSCLRSCPLRCCSKKPFLTETTLQNSDHKYGPQVGQPLSKTDPTLHTSCPSNCATFCSPKCPPSCCAHPQVPKAPSPITSKYTAPSCKPGCSPRCYPLCIESCCKAIERTVQVRPTTRSLILTTTPTKAAYGCPLQCPRSCFPSCSRDCCSAAQQYKPKLLNGHGQYMVSIACPMECRPYNCLSYCHHECCLRTNKLFQHLPKSYISSSKDASNKETINQSRINQFGSQMNKLKKLSQMQNHQKKDYPAKSLVHS